MGYSIYWRVAAITGLLILFQNCGPQGESVKYVSSSSVNTGGSSSGGVAPAAPLNFVATAASSTQITLTWFDNSSNESGFRIERAFSTAGPFSTGMGPFTVLTTTSANTSQYVDSNLQASTLYYYRISAVNNAGVSNLSNVVSATTQAPPTAPPSPPSNLVATPTAATLVALSWSDNSNNESFFKVERSANNGTTYTLVATTSANVHTYMDFNLNPASAYVYRVRASNSLGDSANSNTAMATTLAAGNMASYSYISVNILGPNCVDCHGPNLQAAGYNFSTYNSVVANRNAMMSSIQAGRMPPGAPLSSTQINALNSWISAGTPNN